MLRPPPTSTLFPYTTLFRSGSAAGAAACSGFAEIGAVEAAGGSSNDTFCAERTGDADGADWPTASLRPGSIIQIVDRKSTRLNSSHMSISYAVFCLKKKKRP